jgi:5-methyltetrahydrofolate--homocysteine methyltransferase
MRDQVKVMIGSAPITEDYARQVEMDGYAVDAGRAVDIAKKLLAKNNS